MTGTWDQTRLNQLIDDQIQESLTLDYKGADALDRRKPRYIEEITKDVSALANSAGGVIIYGIAEFDDNARRHLPKNIDPIDSTQYSREWLDQIISTIRPKVDGIIIHPVMLSTAANHTVYVVEVPQSYTAHQARDKLYYKRLNFMSVSMEDYEIRDVMRRNQYPNVQLNFNLKTYQAYDQSSRPSSQNHLDYVKRYNVEVTAVNMGNVFAQYVNTFIHVPANLVPSTVTNQRKHFKNGVEYIQFTTDNFHETMKTYGPFLPSIVRPWTLLPLATCFDPVECGDCELSWTAHADNAPVISGTIRFKDMATQQ